MPRSTPIKFDRTATLLTVAEVARLDAVSEKTVRRAISAGLLDVVPECPPLSPPDFPRPVLTRRSLSR